ncbi:hypothetical protein ACXWRW_09530, partial [Streptococcus pyogenes]
HKIILGPSKSDKHLLYSFLPFLFSPPSSPSLPLFPSFFSLLLSFFPLPSFPPFFFLSPSFSPFFLPFSLLPLPLSPSPPSLFFPSSSSSSFSLPSLPFSLLFLSSP